MNPLRAMLTDLPAPDRAAARAVRDRADDILRPAGALARLDDIAVWMAGWQATSMPRVDHPVGVLFAADHGVAAASDVSAYPTEVTGAMLEAAQQQRTTFHALAAVAGADVVVVDVGVGRPTSDIRDAAALDAVRFAEVVATATTVVDELAATRTEDVPGSDIDLLVLGEMGIGNTTVAAAVARACLGGAAEDWVGRGTGVDDEGLARKQAAVRAAVERVARVDDPVELLREVGGAELVAMAAAIVAARHHRIPVVLDGYVVAAAALPLVLAEPTALDHCIAGHVSAEPGHSRLLDALSGIAGSSVQADPLLDLDLRLGEGSGAMAAVPLIAMACRAVTDVPTFGEWFAS